MTDRCLWQGPELPPGYPANLATMLNSNGERFAHKIVYQQVVGGKYQSISWRKFCDEIATLQTALQPQGISPGDRVAVLSPNRKEMLQLELAIMAMGALFVPIFAGYPAERARELVDFARPKGVIVADQNQFDKLDTPNKYDLVISLDEIECAPDVNYATFDSLLAAGLSDATVTGANIPSDTVCLMMYTSGTMGKPKCVQLTHGNILTQQAAMRSLWKLDENDRFLCYLPWHHSFGGIFEKYAGLYNGAMYSLEHSYGKDLDVLLENWKAVKPTVFFSVPRIYQQIATRVMQDPEVEAAVFHGQLRFIFTAAAPLPKNLSDMFESKGIPVIEGWGLTETSPCCTITDPKVQRESGVVGKPIPGVSLKLADDGEIIVKGPNVMTGYFDNPEETTRVLTSDGWFATGDVGQFTAAGLKLVSRKDRIFKLSNAEKVISTEIENIIVEDCTYLLHAYLAGSGRDHPVVLLFPNKAMFLQRPDESAVKAGCKCPAGLKNLRDCLGHCLKQLNEKIDPKFARPRAAMLIDHELSIEREELTPSMKLAPNVVGRIFKTKIESLYGRNGDTSNDVYVIDLEE